MTRCACSHLEVEHDLNKHGTRTACSVSSGRDARRCPCTTYTPEETPA